MEQAATDAKAKRERKAKAELDSRTFNDGAIYLFRRADYKKPTWFCRVKVPNSKGYVSCSTKTTNEHQAFAFASNLFNETLIKVASGQEINSRLVAKTLRDYIAYVTANEPQNASREIKLSFLNKWIGYFKNERLKSIDTAALVLMNDWFKINSRKGSLSPNTIKRVSTYQKQFFNWCLERGYIDNPPRFPKMRLSDNRRPHFDGKDWAKLTRHLREFVKNVNPNITRDRQLLRDYVLILANTGIRVGEARMLISTEN
jgi:integrase